jgi:hypothetical protein
VRPGPRKPSLFRHRQRALLHVQCRGDRSLGAVALRGSLALLFDDAESIHGALLLGELSQAFPRCYLKDAGRA